jgi:hypothetical protein
MKRRATVGGGSPFERVWWFAFSAPGVRRTIRMTCGPGPSCHRMGRLGVRCASMGISCSVSDWSGRVCLKEGFALCAAVSLSHFLPIAAPFRLRDLCAARRWRRRRKHLKISRKSIALGSSASLHGPARRARLWCR